MPDQEQRLNKEYSINGELNLDRHSGPFCIMVARVRSANRWRVNPHFVGYRCRTVDLQPANKGQT